ncbi:Glycosyl transferase [Aphelenchoides avenae]|nr:Glycosyl transferase [Aphelenchus avenae]
MWVVSRRRRFILLLLLFASSTLVFLTHRSAQPLCTHAFLSPRGAQPRISPSPWQRFHILFPNEHYVYNVSTPSHPDVCDNITLFIGVGTRPESIDKRSAIRRSWAAELPDNVIMRFFVGQTEHATHMKLKEEERLFGDIVFYGLPDAYDKLHLKASHAVHTMMQWQQSFCPQASFWLKTDDDTTIHVTRLLHHIERRFVPAMDGTKAIFCSVHLSVPVSRDRSNKWYVPRELFPDDVYPPFCAGPSYLMSSDAVAAILIGSHFVKAFLTEDALYTGVIAGRMCIKGISDTDVFHTAKILHSVTKCDATGVPLSSAVYIHDGDPTRLQADTLSFMKNQTCLLLNLLNIFRFK